MIHKTIAWSLLGAFGVCLGCAIHEPRPAFRAGILIHDRGISVPLPPPSLIDAPKQDVEVEGEVVSDEGVPEGTIVHVLDTVGGGETSMALDEGTRTFKVELFVDLTQNCLEVWLEAPQGSESTDPVLVHTIITEDDEIVVLKGC